jgi:hypothetical protein
VAFLGHYSNVQLDVLRNTTKDTVRTGDIRDDNHTWDLTDNREVAGA